VTLAETQALLHRLVTSEGPPDPAAVEDCFAGTAELPAADRVAIYKDMYASRLVEALRATFPNVAQFLGEERFAALGEAYVAEFPSEHHDVGRVGRRLAEFLRAHPDPERPDLADLAELEWARNEAFFDPDSGAVGAEALGEAGATARLTLATSLRVVATEHDAAAPWKRIDAGEPVDPTVRMPSSVAVWRRGFDVFHRALLVEEASALRAAREGGTLEVICGYFAEGPDPAAVAHAAISSWFAEGWITGVDLVPEEQSGETNERDYRA
jgi:fermentation-respiration switch protein FrsA (DUF1100 family)